MSQIIGMAQKKYGDQWETGIREGYEDRGSFRPPRAPAREPGSSLLRTLGAIAIVGGICWGVYLGTAAGIGNAVAALQQNHGPIAIVALGVASSVLGKYLRV